LITYCNIKRQKSRASLGRTYTCFFSEDIFVHWAESCLRSVILGRQRASSSILSSIPFLSSLSIQDVFDILEVIPKTKVYAKSCLIYLLIKHLFCLNLCLILLREKPAASYFYFFPLFVIFVVVLGWFTAWEYTFELHSFFYRSQPLWSCPLVDWFRHDASNIRLHSELASLYSGAPPD
jgi:hypothetical protein